jgi:hypothetical protein
MAIYPTRRLGPAVAVLIAATSGGCSTDITLPPSAKPITCDEAKKTAADADSKLTAAQANPKSMLSEMVFAGHHAELAAETRRVVCKEKSSARLPLSHQTP